MKVVSVVDKTAHPGFEQLSKSLSFHKYEHVVLLAPFNFGGQMQHVYQWAKGQDPDTPFVYSDGFDTVAIWPWSGDEAPTHKIVFSAEKACYPDTSLAAQYPPGKSEWMYVNGGGFWTTCGAFAQLYEDTHQSAMNDQLWLSHLFLSLGTGLDDGCKLFQTIAFESEDDFEYSPRGYLYNRKTKTYPTFIHGNGRTDMSRIYQLMAAKYEQA